jgi:tellurite resistance protein
MILAATNPDLTGPVVINGAPLSYWSGRVGENPMRYNGGLLGGILPALLLADLGGGEFDGAHLVSNFEMLNPSRNFFGKYYDLFDNVEKGKARFLEFERWWGGFHFMSEAEIHWIVDQLFIGNKLARNEARLESGRHIDLKNIRSPIIVFASHGDNITPPQQALNWITDAYTDEEEIRVRGQRIVYMVHDKVGHLGIFVSSSVAQKEHAEVASTLQTIEALAPGLYEMVIEEMREQGVDAQFVVSFHERSLQHIRDLDDGRHVEDKAFAAVERLSEFGAEVYDMFGRPMVRAAVSGPVATAVRDLNPARTQRLVFSSRNPTMRWVPGAAEIAAAERKPVAPNNPLREAEKLWASGVEQSLDLMRDVRDAAYEVMFLSIFASPTMQHLGQPRNFVRTKKDREELRWLPEVQAILLNVDRGGYVEAVIRMLILLAQARGSVRRSRLERSAQVLTADAPFSDLGAARRAAIIHEQSVIVEFVPNEAMQALPRLLVGEDERRKALATVEYIAGPLEEMEPHTIHAITSFRKVLGLPEFAVISADEPDQQRKLRTARKASPDNGSTAAE